MFSQDEALKQASRDIARLLAKTPRAFYFQGLSILTAYREMYNLPRTSSSAVSLIPFEPGVFDPRLDEQETDLNTLRLSWEKALKLAIATQDKWTVKTNAINEAFRLAALAIRSYQQKYHSSTPRGSRELSDPVKAMADACVKGATASASLEETRQTIVKRRAASFEAANTMKVDLVIHSQIITQSDVTLSKPTRFTIEPSATMDLMLHRLHVRHQTRTVKARRKARASNHNRNEQSLRSPLDHAQDGTEISEDLARSHIYETWPRDENYFAKIGRVDSDGRSGDAEVQRILPCVWYKRLEDLGIASLHLVPSRPVVFAISGLDKAKHEEVTVAFANIWGLSGNARNAMVLKDTAGSLRLWYEPILNGGRVPPWEKFIGEAALKYYLAETIKNIRFTYDSETMSWKTVFVPGVKDPFRMRVMPGGASTGLTTKHADTAQASSSGIREPYQSTSDPSKERRGSLPKLVVPVDKQQTGPQSKTPVAPLTETGTGAAKGGWWGTGWSLITGTVQKLL